MRGSILADAGNIQEGINDYTAAIAFDSSYYLAYNNRASARMKMNDFASALVDLNKAIQLKNNYAPAWFNRGSVKTSLKDFKGGLADFDESIRLNPSECMGYFGKGNALSGNENVADGKQISPECLCLRAKKPVSPPGMKFMFGRRLRVLRCRSRAIRVSRCIGYPESSGGGTWRRSILR